MKKSVLFIVSILFLNLLQAQSNDYLKQMEIGIAQQDTASSYSVFQSNAAYFSTLSEVEKEEWLPAYYQAYNEMMAAAEVMRKNDFKTCNYHIGQAQAALDQATERAGGANSEILALQSFIYTGHIWENPMEKGATYSGMVFEALDKAIAKDANNPRAYYLKGQMILFSPAFWGGGAQNALPFLEKAAKTYEEHPVNSGIDPNWGQKSNQELLEKARAQVAAMTNN